MSPYELAYQYGVNLALKEAALSAQQLFGDLGPLLRSQAGAGAKPLRAVAKTAPKGLGAKLFNDLPATLKSQPFASASPVRLSR